MATFYTSLIEWFDETRGNVRVFWAWAEHIGEAIEKMQSCARQQGISDPIVSQLDPYDYATLPTSARASDGGQTYFANRIHSYPIEYNYRLPVGVIASCLDGEYDINDIKESYEVVQESDGLFQLHAVIAAERLLPCYESLITTLDTIRVFWLEIQADWAEAAEAALYTNEVLNDPNAIMMFICNNQLNTLKHGHVTLTTYSDQGATNISITDHKVLRFLTYDVGQRDACIRVFEAYGLEPRDMLITIEHGIYHWHYHQPLAYSHDKLIQWLITEGFTQWQPE